MKQDIEELKLLRKGDFKERQTPVFIEKGPDKTSLRRNISGTVEPIGVTVSYRTIFFQEKQSKLPKNFFIVLQISDVNSYFLICS